jgi:hypothetical protein
MKRTDASATATLNRIDRAKRMAFFRAGLR